MPPPLRAACPGGGSSRFCGHGANTGTGGVTRGEFAAPAPRPRSPRQWCGVCAVGGGEEPAGAVGEPREGRGVSVRGRGRYKTPSGRAAPLLPAYFSAVPRRRLRGHLSRAPRGAAGRGPWQHFRAGRQRRRRHRGWAGPDPTRPPRTLRTFPTPPPRAAGRHHDHLGR